MATRPFITRYAKVVPSGEIKPCHKAKGKKSDSPFQMDSVGPNTRIYYTNFFQRLVFQGTFGIAILYPVRISNVYVVSINGKSKIFSSNQELYKFLVQKGIINDNDLLRKEFEECKFLNFLMISFYTKAEIIALPLTDTIVNEKDITFLRLPDKTSYISFIPCLHEDKTVVDAFLATSLIDSDIESKLKNGKMQKIKNGFDLPPAVLQEILESLNQYF